MGKSSDQTSTSTQMQQSSTQPWSAAQPLLTSLISDYTGMSPSLTSGQSGALTNLQNAASGIPSFDMTTPINKMLGASTSPQVGMLTDSLNDLKTSLAPVTDPANLDPYSTPGFSDAINTMTNDITNKVKGVYAGSGRDPSGAGGFAKTLGRGLTEGIAPTIANQFNTNRNALTTGAGMLNSAGQSTAGAITGQEQVPLMDAAQALGLIPGVQTNTLNPAELQYTAATQGYQSPYTNLAALLQPSIALGGMGSQSQGSASGTTTQSTPQSTMGNIMGGLMGGTGILSSMGAFGPAGWLLASDERVKDDIEEVGKLHDGQKVYRFSYKGDPTTRIGLIAQEVAEHEPDAVHMIPSMGMLAVDHKRATNRSAAMRKAA